MMSRVRGANTGPELVVRKLIWSLGYRYRLLLRDLPGRPDIAFLGRKKVIFVHGCFWHRHECPAGRQVPETRVEFWTRKLSRNAERDREIQDALHSKGWSVLVIWSCQLRERDRLVSMIREFLGPVHA
jgi:DNA mismatch endonuclease (patch repair protein)